MTKKIKPYLKKDIGNLRIVLDNEHIRDIRVFIGLTGACTDSWDFARSLYSGGKTLYELKNPESDLAGFYCFLLENIYSYIFLERKGYFNLNKDDLFRLLRVFPLEKSLKQLRKWNRIQLKKRYRF